MKRITIVVAVLSILMFGQACTETNKEMKTIKNTEEKEQYTFKLNDNVTRKAVTRTGMELRYPVIYTRQKMPAIRNLLPSY